MAAPSNLPIVIFAAVSLLSLTSRHYRWEQRHKALGGNENVTETTLTLFFSEQSDLCAQKQKLVAN